MCIIPCFFRLVGITGKFSNGLAQTTYVKRSRSPSPKSSFQMNQFMFDRALVNYQPYNVKGISDHHPKVDRDHGPLRILLEQGLHRLLKAPRRQDRDPVQQDHLSYSQGTSEIGDYRQCDFLQRSHRSYLNQCSADWEALQFGRLCPLWAEILPTIYIAAHL